MSALDDIVERIRDRIQNFGVEDQCWPWTGASTKAGTRRQLMRNAAFEPRYVHTYVNAYGLVKSKGKRFPVHKIVFQWATQNIPKSGNFRLRNNCGNTLCCNYHHWTMVDPNPPQAGGVQTSAPSAALRQDCHELLDSLLATTTPRTFKDVQNHPYMVDFSPELIKEVLCDIGKEHLAR